MEFNYINAPDTTKVILTSEALLKLEAIIKDGILEAKDAPPKFNIDKLVEALEKYEKFRANQPNYEIDVEATITKILVYDMVGRKNELVEEVEFTSMEDFKAVRDKYDAKFRFMINKNKLKKL